MKKTLILLVLLLLVISGCSKNELKCLEEITAEKIEVIDVQRDISTDSVKQLIIDFSKAEKSKGYDKKDIWFGVIVVTSIVEIEGNQHSFIVDSYLSAVRFDDKVYWIDPFDSFWDSVREVTIRDRGECIVAPGASLVNLDSEVVYGDAAYVDGNKCFIDYDPNNLQHKDIMFDSVIANDRATIKQVCQLLNVDYDGDDVKLSQLIESKPLYVEYKYFNNLEIKILPLYEHKDSNIYSYYLVRVNK